MCGITGVFKKDSSASNGKAIIELMTNTIAHRGPDGYGYYIDDSVALGHRRLAIIDIVAGKQPMDDEKSGKIIVYNGEIYNYKELQAEMIKKGHHFLTNCDTEVLLKLCDTGNSDWIDHVVGMFAFAVWDRKAQTLLLGRDRLGIKPLYYIDLPNAFVFSSEIKSLLKYPGVRARLNEKKVNEYIAFRSVSGNETLFDGILELEPGCLLKIKKNKPIPQIVRYWNENKNCMSVEGGITYEDTFLELFDKSTRCRMISDVPLGTFNSGGVDSSLVTSIVKTYKKDDLHTFSVGFKEKKYDESPYAEIVANKLGTIHHKIVIGEQEYINNFEKTLITLEEPINHPHTVPLYLLCKLAKEYVTVVLTGEGADEVFGGYPRYHIPLFARKLKLVPGLFHDFALRLAKRMNNRKAIKLLEDSKDQRLSALNCGRFIPYDDLYRVMPGNNDFLGIRNDIFNSSKIDGTTYLNQLLLYERKTYLQSLLIRLDKVSMASGLEARVPFLDHRLVCWSRYLPDNEKIQPFKRNKVIVKKVASKRLPANIVHRKKVGFGVPIAEWLRNNKGLGRYLELLADRTFKERGYFSYKEVGRMIAEHRKCEIDHSEALWALLNFELWCRQFTK